jgi:hypothetical protein
MRLKWDPNVENAWTNTGKDAGRIEKRIRSGKEMGRAPGALVVEVLMLDGFS